MLVETLGRLANKDEPLSQAPRKWDGEAWQRSYLRQLLGRWGCFRSRPPTNVNIPAFWCRSHCKDLGPEVLEKHTFTNLYARQCLVKAGSVVNLECLYDPVSKAT